MGLLFLINFIMIINEIVLKITSKCNLSCKYCYVYNKGDTSYVNEPHVISDDIIVKLLQKLNYYCELHKLNNFFIVFHGGEPLLAGHKFYEKFISLSNKIVKYTKVGYALQTNGTLLTEEWCNLLKDLNIHVGISIDGNRNTSINRIFKNNMEAYDKIIAGYNIAKQVIGDTSILSVINTSVNVTTHYQFLKLLNVSFMDCLFPNATYEKLDTNAVNLGKWLCDLFDLWYFDDDNNKPAIRIFNTIINIILGNEYDGNEMFGRKYNGVITIKPNGNIESVDTLKICGNGFTKTKHNIMTDALDSINKTNLYYIYYNAHQDCILCDKCKKCIIKEICGGSKLPHRFSIINGFDNPSVYCKDLFLLITHIQNTLIDDLPKELIEKTQIQKLSNNDYN
ncbi:MAG: radical SAM protein [Bacteroidales bacterium]|jgi:uncharacterized protein|nr:radical SAM protein [Bacteroidales bacterium]